MKPNRIYLSPPFMSGFEMQYIQEAFDTNWIAPLGPNVDAFEKEVAAYIGIEHAVALSSGSAAIHMALKYLGVGQGDYVFCSDLTFAGSCNPIHYEKAIPVFIDSEEQTWNMSPVALEIAFEWAKKENKLPKAVIIVDLYGQSADYDALLPLCRKYGVSVIEDAAEAFGATYKGKRCGTFSDIGIFSFNGNKIITTSGGGMLVANDEAITKKVKFWATQAREPYPYYEHKEIGYNYRLSNISAGIGRGQMRIIHDKIQRRKHIYKRYLELFAGTGISMMPIADYGEPNWWLTVVKLNRNDRIFVDRLVNDLAVYNIEVRHLWKPMHMHPVNREYHFFTENNLSEELFADAVCLPSGDALTESDQSQIVRSILKSLEQIV